MNEKLSKSAEKVQKTLESLGFCCEVREMEKSTKSAKEAADAAGCELGQIAKSLVFKGKKTGEPVLVVAGGANRVNLSAVAAVFGEPLEMAKPEFVREKTGFAIGGVPPVGHAESLTTFLDEDLFQFDRIFAAAGTPRALFGATPDELAAMTGGRVICITRPPEK